MNAADRYEIAKMLGDMQSTPEWEVVRKRNAYVISTTLDLTLWAS